MSTRRTSKALAPQRRRPRRRNKDEVARELIDWHFSIDPRIQKIFWILSVAEEDEEEAIKLLEIDAGASETGRVDAFRFGPAGDITYPTEVALITPFEFELVKRRQLQLPEGWNLESAVIFDREEYERVKMTGRSKG